ncbi:hypothetical protein ACQP1K_06635 [Sphaerimonospora sp. CA-214678]|uniref:hypothetical protein n=1 Tax=Sphaerimonospora sp. CA-214678 TaxID=3240029 RepID=UPI003D9151B8
MLQISWEDVHQALDDFDPVTVVVDELTGEAAGDVAGLADVGRFIEVEDPASADRFLLPAGALRTVRGSCLAVAAAQLLLPPGAATVCVLGSESEAAVLLKMIIQYVRDVGHVAVCVVDGPPGPAVTRRVRDELVLAGIDLTVGTDAGEALFGANLVAVGRSRADPGIEKISKGAILVNAGGRDLPTAVVAGAAAIYVDDMRLIGESTHRYFVREHLARLETPATGRRHLQPRARPVSGDLGGLLSGDSVPRKHPAEHILVELLSTETVSARLACELGLAARRLGLGKEIDHLCEDQRGR